jgi:hypothetical protein
MDAPAVASAGEQGTLAGGQRLVELLREHAPAEEQRTAEAEVVGE